MSFLFKHKTRTPAELVKQIRVDLEGIEGIELGSASPGKLGKKLSFQTMKGLAFKDGAGGDVATQKAAKHLGQLRKMLMGDESIDAKVSASEGGDDRDGNGRDKGSGAASTSASDPKDCAAAVVEMCSQGLIKDLCLALTQLNLEVCRDITTCVNTAVGYTLRGTGKMPGVDCLKEDLEIFDILSAGFKDDTTALHCGNILRYFLPP